MKKIAAMAEVHYSSVAPHNPCGPVATAVNVHFAASTSNFEVLEYKADEGRRADIVDEPVKLVDGYLDAAAAARTRHRPEPGSPRRATGPFVAPSFPSAP